MAEEVPQTADGAVRAWFAAAGFTCVLIGGELIVLHSATLAGIILLVASAPFYWAAYKWPWLKSQIDAHLVKTISLVATDARWWFGALFVLLIALIFSPFLEQRRWPFSHFIDHRSLIPSEITKEFERVHTPLLGSAIKPIEMTTDAYQAAHEHAMVISLLPILEVFVLPADQQRKAIRQHDANWHDDRKWFDDKYLRTLFPTPDDKNPPEYRVAELWSKNPKQWEWIGWREWSCFWALKDTFYYQLFENGFIFGVLPTGEIISESQIFVVANSGEWSSSISSSVSAPACNEKTVRVNGTVIHGHFVK